MDKTYADQRFCKPQERKYHNRKIHICGMDFDSKKESERYFVLRDRQRRGETRNLQRQVKFTLIPKQAAEDTVGPHGKVTPGKVLERECAYYADFVYEDKQGNVIVEDVKSPATRTDVYRIKKKLMLYVHGIQIKEV